MMMYLIFLLHDEFPSLCFSVYEKQTPLLGRFWVLKFIKIGWVLYR